MLTQLKGLIKSCASLPSLPVLLQASRRCAAVLLLLAFGAISASAADGVTDQLVVRYKADAGSNVAQANLTTFRSAHEVANRLGLQLRFHRRTVYGSTVFRLDKWARHLDLEDLGQKIKALDANVLSVAPDRLIQALWVPADTHYAAQWYLFDPVAGINAPPAWDRTRGQGVTVAVIDTGVRPHQDLLPNLLPGYDFISSAWRANDGNGKDADATDAGDWVAAGECGNGKLGRDSTWHGTAVSGVIAAVANNGAFMAGIASNAKIVPVRVLGKCGGYETDIAEGILWAAGADYFGANNNPNPAHVINLSLGGPYPCDQGLRFSIDVARSKGAVIVVAAGNSAGDVQLQWPANCEGVIAVAALNRSAAKAGYSNFGALVKIAAPGGEGFAGGNAITTLSNSGSTVPVSDSIASVNGTSFAAPMVSGVAALVRSLNPNLLAQEIEQILVSTARPFPAPCSGCGAGIVDANAATAAATGPRKFFVELLGTTNGASSWRVRNSGTVAVSLQALTLSPVGGPSYIEANTCAVGGMVAPGTNCMVTTRDNLMCSGTMPYYLVAQNLVGTSQSAMPAYVIDAQCGS